MAHRVAVIGAGGIAAEHLEAIREMDELVPAAVADKQELRAKELADTFGAHPYTDYKEMIRTEKPDIAVIALPHYLHKEAAVFCAGQGCHILLEKPMALNLSECDQIIQAVRQNRVKMLVGHTQHYIAENVKAKQIIEEGILGRLVMINDTRHTDYYKAARPQWFFEKAKAGGGILMNLGSHSVDKIQWFCNSQITKVKASLSYYGTKGDVEGSGLVFAETEAGVPATISQSGYFGANKNETEFMFTNGMLKLATGTGLWVSEGGQYRQVPVDQKARPFVLQFRDLIRSMETGEEPECSMAYSRSIAAVIDGIYLSHELGREVGVGG